MTLFRSGFMVPEDQFNPPGKMRRGLERQPSYFE